jgi:hypothetical protein
MTKIEDSTLVVGDAPCQPFLENTKKKYGITQFFALAIPSREEWDRGMPPN